MLFPRASMQQLPILAPNGTEQAMDPVVDRLRWNKVYAKVIGITFIFIASFAIACHIAWFAACAIEPSLTPVGVGFWAGGLVLVTGVLMTASGFRPSRCLIVSVLVMSIITNVFDIAFISVGAIYIAMSSTTIGLGVAYVVIGIVCFGLLLATSILSCISL